MAIHVDVLLDVHERELRKATSKLKREADKLGQDLSDRISKGFKGVSPQAVKALDAETDAMVRLRRATADYTRVSKSKTATDEDQLRSLEDLSKAIRNAQRSTEAFTETNKRELTLTRQRAQIMGQNTKAFKDFRDELGAGRAEIAKLSTANAALIRSNDALARNFDKVGEATKKTTKEHDKYNRMVADGNATREQLIRQSDAVRDAYEKERTAIAGTTEAVTRENQVSRERAQIMGQNVQAFSRYRREIDQYRTGVQWMSSAHAGLIATNLGLQRSMERVGDATTKTTREHEKYNRMVADGNASREQLISQSQSIRDAYEKERRAIRDATDAVTRHHAESVRAAQAAGAASSATGTAGNFFNQLTKFGAAMMGAQRVMTPIAGIGVGAALVEIAGVAASAAQGLWLLPAAAGAAGAALGTLELATAGFSDAIKDMGDPKKWAEALQKLSPNAQQAALSIQALMPALTELKNFTQDEFMEGFSEQFNRLATTMLPMTGNLTGGIADAFNKAFMGATNQLMTPETQSSLQTFVDNTVEAFQLLAPAAAPFTKAIADIMAVGSGFLPDLARSITEAAESFSKFIANARQSGELKRWLGEGLDTLKQLGGLIADLAADFMTLAPVGRASLPFIVDALTAIGDILPAIGYAAMLLGPSFGVWLAASKEVARIGQAIDAAFEFLSPMISVVDNLTEALRNMGGPLEAIARILFPLANIDLSNLSIPGFGSNGSNLGNQGTGPGGMSVDKGPPGLGNTTMAPGPGGYFENRGAFRPNVPGHPGADGYTVPGIPPDELSDSEKMDAAIAALNPSQWRVDPYAAMPGAPGQPPGTVAPRNGPPPGATPYSGYMEVDPQQVLEADRKVQSEARDLEEARRKRLAMESANIGTAQDLENAKWAEVEAGWRLQEAQADLAEEQQGTWKKLTDGLEGFQSKLSASLDADLGISKGLPGIADNLVRFFATLAAAPVLGELEARSWAAGGPEKTGSGLIGMLAQQGAFGPQYTPAGIAMAEAYEKGGPQAVAALQAQTGMTSGAVATTAASTNANVNAMLALAQSTSGRVAYDGASDLAGGLADCSGSVSDLYEVLRDGQATPAREFTTTNFASDAEAAKLGFLPGFVPGAFNVGVNPYPGMSGHMAATLPNGVNYEGGGGTGGGGQYGGSAAGALDPQFEKQYHLPLDGTTTPGASPYSAPGAPGAPGGTASLSTPFGSIPIPLPVTIVGGMPAGPAAPGGGRGNAAAAAAGGGGGGTPGADWEAMARLESGGQWNLPSGDADSSGGLQIQKRTWDNYNGPALTGAEFPWQASKEDQIRIAELILAKQGPSAWAGGKNFVPWGGGAADTFNPANPGAAPAGLPPINTNPGLTNPPAPPPGSSPLGDLLNGVPGFARGGPVFGRDRFRPPFSESGSWGPLPAGKFHGQNRSNPFWVDDGNADSGGGWHFGPMPGNTGNPGVTIWDILRGRGGPQDIDRTGMPGKNGIGATDTVPAMLTPGEFVVNRTAAGMFGPLLHHINGFWKGGPVPGTPPPILPPPPAPPKAPTPPPGSTPNAPVGGSAGTGIASHLSPGGPASPGALPSPGRAGFNAVANPTQIGGGEPVHQPGGGAGQGGLAGTLTAAAAMAADAFAPGAGAAVQTASQLIQRSIKFGAQVAGIGAQGLMETFLPFGGSELANNNWLTRIGGAFAGVAPQIPNVAGKSASVDQMMKTWSPTEPMAGQFLDQKLQPPAAPPPPPTPAPVHGPRIESHTQHVWNVNPTQTALEQLGGLQAESYASAPGAPR